MRRRSFARFVPLALFLVVGCVNLEEDLRLSSDGSGSAHIVYTHSLQLMRGGVPPGLGPTPIPMDRKELLQDLKDPSGVVVESATQRLTGKGLRVIDARLKFRSVESLDDSRLTYRFERDGLGHRFTLTILNTDKKSLPQDTDPNAAISRRSLLLSMVSGYHLHFTVHFPGTILSTNATRKYGRTLIWDVPLQELLTHDQMVLEAKVGPSLWERIQSWFARG